MVCDVEMEYDVEYDCGASSWTWSAAMIERAAVYNVVYDAEYDCASSWTCNVIGQPVKVRLSDWQSRDGLGTSVQGCLSEWGVKKCQKSECIRSQEAKLGTRLNLWTRFFKEEPEPELKEGRPMESAVPGTALGGGVREHSR